MDDTIRVELNALSQKLDAHIVREERLENAVIENGKAIAENRSAIARINDAVAENRKAIDENRKAIARNGEAIARIDGKITGGILIIGIAAGLLGPLVMVIVNLVSG